MPVTDDFAWYFGIVEWDGATAVELDLSQWGEQIYALLTGDAQDQTRDSEMPITFPIDTPFAFPIRVKREWVAGYRRTLSRVWDTTRKVWGGYIEQQEGDTEGYEHIILVTLSNDTFLLDTVDVLSWPGDVDSPAVGYLPDFSVAAWLVGRQGWPDVGGTIPYDGLIPARLGSDGGVLLDGVDPIFWEIVLPATALPAPEGVIGAFGKTDLRECVTDLCALIRYLVPGTDPVGYLDRAVDPTDPTRLRPRFRLVDRAATGGGIVAHLSTEPLAGVWQIIRPYSHLLKGQKIRTRVVTMGETGDATLPGTPLVYAIATVPEHLAAYPTRYHTDPGWSGKPFVDNRLDTRAKALTAAEALEARMWGSEDTITVYTLCDFIQQGDLITLTDPVEVYDHTPFPVASSVFAPRDGAPYYKIVIGLPSPTILEIIRDAARGVRAGQPRRGGSGQGDLSGAGVGSTGLPGTPRRIPIETTPVHSGQNVGQALNDTTTWLSTRPGQVPDGGTRTTDPIKRIFHDDTTGTAREWVNDADGTGHPHHYILGPISATGVFFWVAPDSVDLVRAVKKDKTGALATGVSLSGWKVDNVSQTVPGPTTPLHVPRESVVQVTVSGTLPTGGISLLVSET